MLALLGAGLLALLWGSAAFVEKLVATSNPAYGTVLVTRALVTLMTAIPLAVAVAIIMKQPVLAHTPATWLWALASQLCTAGGAALNLYLLRSYPASIIVPLSGLYPLVGTLLAVVVLRETLSLAQIVGILLLGCGLVLILRGSV